MSGSDTRSGRNIIGVFAMVIDRVVSIVGWLAKNWFDLLMAGCVVLIGAVVFWSMFL
jgi:hypothetical protein